jgi:hypothetical protein
MFDHIFFDAKAQEVGCDICSERVPLKTPMKYLTFMGMMKGFAQAHKKCEKKGDG